jgi:hypothetical protein
MVTCLLSCAMCGWWRTAKMGCSHPRFWGGEHCILVEDEQLSC